MPPVDPSLMPPNWQAQQQPQLPSQPMPFPGTTPRIIPRGAMQAANEAERLRIAQETAARTAANEAERLRLAREEAKRAEEKAARDRKKAEQTGGIDTTEAENTAAFLTTQLSSHVNKINEILKDRPEAIKPGWAETIGGLFGERTRAMATPDAVQDVRNTLNNRYSLAADVLLTLGTGAAYTAEQKKAYVESYSPKVTDGPETLEDKRNMMREAVIAARAKSGAATSQIDRALAEIDKLYKVDPTVDFSGEKELSTTVKTVDLPQGYQEDHNTFIREHPRGTLTVEDYSKFRRSLDEKYAADMPQGAHTNQDAVKLFVKEYNAGKPISKIGPIEKPLSEVEKSDAEFASSPLGTGLMNYANAATAGAVDLAVGQKGREAKDLANEQNWKSALTGEVLGSIAPLALAENAGIKIAGRFANPATATAIKKLSARGRLGVDVGANTLYGGTRGFAGADEGEGVEGAQFGALTGGGSAGVANLALKGARPFLSAATIKALEATPGIKKSVLQSIGQGRVEKAFSHIPGASGERRIAFESLNTDNVNRALRNVGEKLPKGLEPGIEQTAYMNKVLNNKYNQILPRIVGAPDAQYRNQFMALKTLNASTPEKAAMFKEIEDAQALFFDTGGRYTGQGYRNASDRLRALTKTWGRAEENQGNVAAGDMARAAETARKQLQHLVQRRTPEVAADLKKLERAWAHSVRIEDAAERAATTGDTVYSASQYVAAIKKHEPVRGRFARGKALDQDYAMAAQKLLGSGNVPEISPLQTSAVLGAIGGSTFVSPAIPTIIGAITLGLYGPGAKQTVKAILSGKRPSAAESDNLRRVIEDAMRHQVTGD